jgi:DnaK suppressor protein
MHVDPAASSVVTRHSQACQWRPRCAIGCGILILEAHVDNGRAKELLAAERRRVERALQDSVAAGQDDRGAANESGDMADPAERLTAEQVDDAVTAGLHDRLAAIERAEARVGAGTYGLSVRSGDPIPDERLEADPAAELTVVEAAQN